MRSTRAIGLFGAVAFAAAGWLAWRAHVSARRAQHEASCATGDWTACEAVCARDELEPCLTLGDLTRETSPDRARAAYGVACEGHVARACSALGRLLESGAGGAADLPAAAAGYRKACDANDEEACGRLGLLTRAGSGVARDDAAAAPLLDRGCNAGHGDDCFAFAEMAERGEGVDKSLTRAGMAYVHGCSADEPRSCLWLARQPSLRVSFVPSYMERACVAHDAPGCADAIYGDSPLVDAHFGGTALALRTCHAGDARACAQAGLDALGDVHAPLDYAAAVDLLTRACDSDRKLGCVELANLFERGLGTQKDSARAESLARRACGDAAKHLELGWSCPKTPKLRVGHGGFLGRLSEEVVVRVLHMASNAFPTCWTTRGLNVNGTVGIKLVISRDGTIGNIEATSRDAVDVLTADCVLNVIRELRFPPPEGGMVTLQFPLVLGSGQQ